MACATELSLVKEADKKKELWAKAVVEGNLIECT
jgi:hypothetical protein